MKLRIIYKKGKYYCEYKTFIFWRPLREEYAYFPVKFETFGESVDWIEKRIALYKSQQQPDCICKEYTI